jgi:bis(5'-nucleosyl)-tetraphosphatase (symmetrical)
VRWVVGDVQGCVREFESLLRLIRFDPRRDELWCLGDLVGEARDSLAVLDLWRDAGGRAVLGNWEIALLLTISGTKPRKKFDPLLEQSGAAEALAELRDLPVLVHLPAAGNGPEAWLVHAGLHPGWTDLRATAARFHSAPREDAWLQSEKVAFATTVRCCDESGRRCRYSGPPAGCPSPYRPWDDFYSGSSLIVHGHWAWRGHYRSERTLGLDSGCVYGGSLTAWCQEEDRIVQIPARSRRQ